MTLDEWVERLSPGELPVFRHTKEMLLDFVPRRDEITARDLANVVLADPLASFRIMHFVNRKLGSRYGTEVTTVEHALMMQGLGIYLDNVHLLPVLEDAPVGQDAFSYRVLCRLARRAQHAAWQARDFAVLHTDLHAEEVQVAALLHYVPGFLLWLRAPEAARKLTGLRRRLPVAEAESGVLGITTKDLQLPLLAAWNIPDSMLDLLDDKHPERARQTILAACFDIARHADRGWWNPNLLADYVALAGVENTPMEVVIATVHMNAARVARADAWLPEPAAAAWLPLEQGVWPPDEIDAEVDTDAVASEAAPAPEPSPALAPAEEDVHAACPMPDKQVLGETLKNINAHLDGSLNLNQMSAVVLKGLHTGLGLTRLIFAMITPDGRKVKSRFSVGIAADSPLRHFEFPLGGSDLFCQLMGKMQGVWINSENRARLWPLVGEAQREMIGDGDFYAMSLFSDGKAIGLIYADRGHGECGLDPHTYTDFKMLCLQSARGLGKVKAG